jgi:hypothetical protein
LIDVSPGRQEWVFVDVAKAIKERASPRKRIEEVAATRAMIQEEVFGDRGTWNRLVQIGNFILDEQGGRIIGSGTHAYLVSREEYGEVPFVIDATLEFTNFTRPQGNKLGMNAGVVFGFKHEREIPRYYNVLLTGSDLLVERNAFGGRPQFEHITPSVPLQIESGKSYNIKVLVGPKIEIRVNDRSVLSLDRPRDIVGRVGLRPWRSKMDCTKFVVSAGKIVGQDGMPVI